MSFVIAAPNLLPTAATDLHSIGSVLNEAHVVAAVATTSMLPAGADEVSASPGSPV